MSKAWCVWVVLAAAGPAVADDVTEPNALAVPVNGNNGEVELDTFFEGLGENIDWQADAKTTPSFYPLACGTFTAKYALNQAANHYGLSWYNDTGSAPTTGELHTIASAGTSVGTVITSVNIVADPSYTGGAVGFALVGGQTHYTNPAYDVECTSCVPPAPWIMALIYASASTPNAYNVAFEDGTATASSFGNDGDFNDDVFFVTGLSADVGDSACSGTTPVCVQPTCTTCNGDHGSTATASCPLATAPHCNSDGTCVAAVPTPDAGVADASTNPETGDASTTPTKGSHSGGCAIGGSGSVGWLVALATLAAAKRRRR